MLKLPQPFFIADSQFDASLAKIKVYSTSIHTDRIDRYFTDHGIEHSNRIIAVLSQLLTVNRQIDLLTELERYVLIAAIYLHDIGMQNEKNTSDDVLRRDEHHLITSKMISESWSAIGIEADLVDVIKLVSEGHRGEIGDKYTNVSVRTCQEIRCDLLAALIQLGDELDVTHERVNLTRKKALNFSVEADIHFFKHYYTDSIAISTRQELIISFRYPEGRSSQYHPFFSKLVLNKLNNSISNLSTILIEKYNCYLTLPSEPSLKETNTVESVPADIFEKMTIGYKNLKPLSTFQFNRMVGDTNAELFFKGSVRWEDIVNNLDIKRDCQTNILCTIEELLDESNKSQDRSLLLITGAGGSGKSTLLQRIAYETYSIENISNFTNLLWHTEGHEINQGELLTIYNATLKPIILFVDANDINILVSALVESENKPAIRIPIVYIIAARTNEWNNNRCDLFRFCKTTRYLLGRLSPQEIVQLITRLDKYNQLYELKDLSDKERYDAFDKKADRDLLVGMLEATRGENFDKIIFSEYQNLKKVAYTAAVAYEYISLFYSFNTSLPKSILKKHTHCVDDSEFESSIIEKARFIIILHYFSFGQEFFRPRHRVIADELLKQLPDYNSPSKCLKRATSVFQVIDPFSRVERYILLDFLKNYLDIQIRRSKAEFDDRLFEVKTILNENKDKIESFIKCAAEKRHISELFIWSKLFNRVGLLASNIYTLNNIITCDRFNREANYSLALQLLKFKTADRNYDDIYECFNRAFIGGFRRIVFLYDFLKFCIRNAYESNLDKLFEAIEHSIPTTPEEEDLRYKMESIISGYKVERDKEKLVESISALADHIAISKDLTAKDLFEYIDVVQSQDPLQAIKSYEEYLEMTSNRTKVALLTLARLCSRIPSFYNKAIEYYEEVFKNFIRPEQIPTDNIILIDYAKLAISLKLKKEKIYEILRFSIQLQATDLLSYLLLSDYAKSCGDVEMAYHISEKGIEMAKKLSRFQSSLCFKLRQINKNTNRNSDL